MIAAKTFQRCEITFLRRRKCEGTFEPRRGAPHGFICAPSYTTLNCDNREVAGPNKGGLLGLFPTREVPPTPSPLKNSTSIGFKELFQQSDNYSKKAKLFPHFFMTEKLCKAHYYYYNSKNNRKYFYSNIIIIASQFAFTGEIIRIFIFFCRGLEKVKRRGKVLNSFTQ